MSKSSVVSTTSSSAGCSSSSVGPTSVAGCSSSCRCCLHWIKILFQITALFVLQTISFSHTHILNFYSKYVLLYIIIIVHVLLVLLHAVYKSKMLTYSPVPNSTGASGGVAGISSFSCMSSALQQQQRQNKVNIHFCATRTQIIVLLLIITDVICSKPVLKLLHGPVIWNWSPAGH